MSKIFASPVRWGHLAPLVISLTSFAASPAATDDADPPSSKVAKSATGAETTSDRALNRRVLSEFGPYRTEAEATSTLDKALRALIDQGSGLLVIPRDAPAN